MKKEEYEELKSLFSEFNIAADRLTETYKLLQESFSKLDFSYGFNGIIGKSKCMRNIYEIIKSVSKSKAPVFIYGESGTGKELISRAIHYESDRRHKPFIAINCAAVPKDLLESEMFGHEKGAFTGAVGRKGKFELANGGTLLLDEISEMNTDLQAKLLRVLQEFKFYRVGGTNEISVDVRVIATTNKDPREAIMKGYLREDLYYRLNVVSIYVPPLRERKEDIPLLAAYFLKKYSTYYGKKLTSISSSCMRKLLSYDWPGNVRELENLIERSVILNSSSEVLDDIEFLPKVKNEFTVNSLIGLPLKEVEKILILETLKLENGNQTRAAKILQITPRTLRNKLKEYGVSS